MDQDNESIKFLMISLSRPDVLELILSARKNWDILDSLIL